MKFRDIRLLSEQACKDRLREEVAYLIKLRFAHAVSPIENPMKIRQTKRIVARLKTAQSIYRLKKHPEV